MLRLAFDGEVLRVRDGLVVVTIERPEFRTAGKSTASEKIAAMASGIQALEATKVMRAGAGASGD
jgi:hypothetical protein